MKFYQNRFIRTVSYLFGLVLVVSVDLSTAAPIDFATTPLGFSGSNREVKPNMLFIMDDSGSMGEQFMPNWSSSSPEHEGGLLDSSYNVMAYDPAFTYEPPVNFTADGIDTTTFRRQTGTSAETGGINWRAVPMEAFTSPTFGTFNLGSRRNQPEIWVTIPEEYCTKQDLKVCVAQTEPSDAHPFPAPLRWCSSEAAADTTSTTPSAVTGRCQGLRVENGYSNPRMPAIVETGNSTATITFGRLSSATAVENVTVNIDGVNHRLMPRRTRTIHGGGIGGAEVLADLVAESITRCSISPRGACTITGTTATVVGRTVTITAPSRFGAGSPSVFFSVGASPVTATAFVTPPPPESGRVKVTLVPNNDSYAYPGSNTKAPDRTDCAGDTCTYAEEMTNYATWYAYYRTRMKLMKTAVSLGFKDVGDEFNMGYATINRPGGSALDLKNFDAEHKAAWYAKLFVTPTYGGTPLRDALARAGRVYAHRELLTRDFTDPVEHSCQQHFALLTTDGIWTDQHGAGDSIRGVADIGDADGDAPRPYNDGPGTVVETLADVAKYYRDTDLRANALGNCINGAGNNVCGTGATEKQTMVTMTLGLGVDGTLGYTTDYKTAETGDFADIKAGNKDWPNPHDGVAERTDDLWHAAVNGDGTYFSARKPAELVRQFRQAIEEVALSGNRGGAAAASSQTPVVGNNFFYESSYLANAWTGNLVKREILLDEEAVDVASTCVEDVVVAPNCDAPGSVLGDGDGTYSCVTPGITDSTECAGTLVGTDCKVSVATNCSGVLKTQATSNSWFTTTRKVLFNYSGTLRPFTFNDLSQQQRVALDKPFLRANLSQGLRYTPAQLVNLTGTNFVNYIKGDPSFEFDANGFTNQLFRKREAILGDVVNSSPIVVSKPELAYSDSGYAAFKASQAGRDDVVYVGSNDGMLHAFDADTLRELWAFIPSAVIPNLWKLADSNYANKHAFFVNGDQSVGDICTASDCSNATARDWKTILVGGLRSGGRGYYALDITNPRAPKILWEFDATPSGSATGDPNLGYSFGRPHITKRSSDEKWVVVFSSGYNNIPDDDSFYDTTSFKPSSGSSFTGGNGIGQLYVVDAGTGSKLNVISTAVGSVAAPSGLGQTRTAIRSQHLNNLTTHVYGGDLLGNVWRFNIADNTVFKVAKVFDNASNPQPQPITTKLNIAALGDNKRMILLGTGKFLEVSDLNNSQQQTVYGIVDKDSTINNPRSTSVAQTLTVDPLDPDSRLSSNNGVELSEQNGWYVDLDSSERVELPPELIGTNFVVTSTVPSGGACDAGGFSWTNYFNYKTGGSVIGTEAVSQRSPRIVGNSFISFGGKVYNNPTAGTVGGERKGLNVVPTGNVGGGFQLRRSIWRELIE